ncbi:acrosomal protein KIAA1210 homolog [Herpailurus yagouaroundi]|uniref:acrosomal protein KIAA1210 homolog n=1 Tax=Herpailurus yagouaroundi TaxID=1608482 RepID=UPI001AD6BAFA|nr:acrosomal protein KIAA1210 homolog [Puma yagouaroundi]
MPIGVSVERREVTLYPSYVFLLTPVGLRKSLKVSYDITDPTMAESLREASGSLEVLEAGDEGKKKSKFKVFKSFFGKKKKKEPEDGRGGRKLQPSLSSSNINISALKPVHEDQTEPRAKSNMGSKALSHDSIFMMDPEPANKIYPSPELQRGRSLQRPYVSRTLPRTGTSSLHRAVFGVTFGPMLPYVPRSALWAGGSDIAESPSLLPRQRSISPPLIRSDTISKDLEEISVDEESPESSPKDVSEQILTMKKGKGQVKKSGEISSLGGHQPEQFPARGAASFLFCHSLQSSFEPSPGPVHSQSLTTLTVITSPSSAQLPIGFSTPASPKVEPKQGKPGVPLVSQEEKSTTTSQEAVQKKPKNDSAGTSSLEQSKKTETPDKKTAEQTANPDAAGTQGYLPTTAFGRQCARRGPGAIGMSECGLRGRTFKQFPVFSADLSLEQSTTPPAISVTPQEGLSDTDGLGKRNTGMDFKAGTAAGAQSVPEDVEGSTVGDPSTCREDGAPGANRPEAMASLSSAATEAEAFKDPSRTQSGREEACSSDLQGIRLETPPLRSLSLAVVKFHAEEESSDSESSSEVGGGSDQVPPRPASQQEKPKGDQKVFPKPGSSAVEPSRPGQQLASRSPSWAGARPEAEEASLDSESVPEDEDTSEQQVRPGRSLQSAGKPDRGQEVFAEPKSPASKVLGEPKVSTEWHSYADKYKSADPSRAWKEKPKDQGGTPSVSKSVLKEWDASMQRLALQQLPQSFAKPAAQQQVSSGLVRALARRSGFAEHLLPQSGMGAKAEQQASACLESTARDWGLSLEPLPPRTSLKHLMGRKVGQPVSKSPEIAMTPGVNSAALKCHSKPPPKPTAGDAFPPGPKHVSVSKQVLPPKDPFWALLRSVVEKQVPPGAESAVVEKDASMQPLVPKHRSPRQPLVRRQVSVSPESAAAEGGASGGPLLPTHSARPLVNPQSQQISENAAVKKGTAAELPRGGPFQPSGRPRLQAQTLPPGSVSASEGSGPEEKMPPPHTSRAWVSPRVEQEASSGSASAPAARSTPVESKPPKSALQAWGNRKSKQAASTGLEGAVAEKGGSKVQRPPRMSSQSPMKPVGKQAVSAGPESVAAKKEACAEPLPPRQFSRSLAGHKVQQISSNFESSAAEGAVSGKPLPPKNPTQVLVRSKVQEMSLRLENKALEGNTSKKSPIPRYPSQSFVKYMAERVFSESPAAERGFHTNPPSTNPPSKPSMRPEAQGQVFSGQKNASMGGGISSQLLPWKGPLRSSGRPEDPKEASSHSESAPAKSSGSKKQPPPRYLSQALGKLEYQQYGSLVSVSALEDRKSFKDKLPSGGPSQAKKGPESQPHVSSTGSASARVGWSCSEGPLPRRSSFWAFADPEHQRQVPSGSVGAAAEGAISGSNPSSRSVPKGPASPHRAKKRSHSSEDLIKNILASAAKPVKFTFAPASQTSTSGVTYPKEEVVKSSDPNNSHSDVSTAEADVENVFGIRVRKIPTSDKFKDETQDDRTKLSSLSLGPKSFPVCKGKRIRRSASHGFLGTAEHLIPGYEFAEKQQDRPKSEIIAGNQPACKVPGKAPGRQEYYSISDPTWITELRTKNRATIKEPSRAGDTLEDENQPASSLTFSVNKQESARPSSNNKRPKIGSYSFLEARGKLKGGRTVLLSHRRSSMSLTACVSFAVVLVGFEDEGTFQELAVGKGIQRSSTPPAMLQEPVQPEEPVWFSVAKKKAKAWSQEPYNRNHALSSSWVESQHFK